MRGTAPLEQLVLVRKAGGSGARGDAQLAIEGSDMPVDGARTNHQVLGNLRIGETLGKPPQYLDLAGRQSERQGGWLQWRSCGWPCGQRSGGQRLFLGRQGLLRGQH